MWVCCTGSARRLNREVDFCCCVWRSPGSNLRPLVYKASDLTTAPRRLRSLFCFVFVFSGQDQYFEVVPGAPEGSTGRLVLVDVLGEARDRTCDHKASGIFFFFPLIHCTMEAVSFGSLNIQRHFNGFSISSFKVHVVNIKQSLQYIEIACFKNKYECDHEFYYKGNNSPRQSKCQEKVFYKKKEHWSSGKDVRGTCKPNFYFCKIKLGFAGVYIFS